MEALNIVLPLYEQIPYLENYLETALEVLQRNGVDIEDLIKRIRVALFLK